MKKQNKKSYIFIIILLVFLIIYDYSFGKTNQNIFFSNLENSILITDYDQDDYYKKDFIRNENYIYKKNIKTVLLHKEGWEMSAPVIRLNTDDKLKLSFDDLEGDVKDYKYTIIHCNANWKTSDIPKSKYIDGFTIDEISDYQYSFNTHTEFTHYETIFPSDYTKPIISGNYILKVFDDDDKDENVIFTFRFMIVEQKVSIEASIHKATSIADMNYKQEIDFTVHKNGFEIANPYRELTVILQQNGRWDNIIYDLKAQMIKGNDIIYNHDKENVFNGGNEFRNFDIKDLRYQSERIKKIDYFNNINQVFLHTDNIRPYKVYISQQDINGKKLIKTSERRDTPTEADYSFVHFTLPYPVPLIDGELYILGSLTNWQLSDDNRLKYNYETKAYETSLFLKQGYYNYLYAFQKNGKSQGDISFIEGNHFETENDYNILVYYREPGTQYDQLINYSHYNSQK